MADIERILIVHAHPEPQSFSSAMHHKAMQTLQAQGAEVKTSNLYAMQWNPVASADDFLQPQNPDYLVYALEQRHACKAQTLAPDIRSELDKLLWCDLLILNFPLYWFSVPAILKGWIDRVLVSGICYGGMRFYDQGGLTGKKALLSLSLGGQTHMFGEGSIHGRLEDMLLPLLRGTLAYVGLTVLPPFVAWHVPYISDQQRQDFLSSYGKRLDLGMLNAEQPLEFPQLAEFDAKLYPLVLRSEER